MTPYQAELLETLRRAVIEVIDAGGLGLSVREELDDLAPRNPTREQIIDVRDETGTSKIAARSALRAVNADTDKAVAYVKRNRL